MTLALPPTMNEKEQLFMVFAESLTKLVVRYPSSWDEIEPLLEVFREMEEERSGCACLETAPSPSHLVH